MRDLLARLQMSRFHLRLTGQIDTCHAKSFNVRYLLQIQQTKDLKDLISEALLEAILRSSRLSGVFQRSRNT